MEHSFEPILRTGLASMGLPAEEAAIGQMKAYASFLLERNQVMNLTAITDPAAVAQLHFLDSAALLKAAPLQNARVIDVGTGAGFPGVPLKLLEPSVRLTLLDSQRKRVDFLREGMERLDLTDVICIQARAEEQSRAEGWRESFDCAVSRAVADLRVLLELCLPFVRVGGVFLAMKSVHCEEEIDGARRAVAQLGGMWRTPFCYTLLDGTPRQILVIEKKKETPLKYPRRFAKIQKEPL